MRLALLLTLMLAGCDGFFKGEDTGADSGVPADDSEVTIDSAPPPEACGQITEDTTWTPDNGPITMSCDVKVLEATLTITAGTRIRSANGASLEIGNDETDGALIIEGTEDAPVIFSPTAGNVRGGWAGLLVNAEGEAEIRWAELRGAGNGEGAALLVTGAEVLLEDVTIQDSSETGLRLRQGGTLHEDSRGLRITGCEGWPAIGTASLVHSLPAEGSDYTGNDFDAVGVEGATIEDQVVWEDLGVPYAVLGNVELEGVASAPARLDVLGGVELLFDDGRSVRVSRRGGEAELSIGEAGADPVRMSALQASEPGFWGGVQAYDGAQEVSLVNVSVEYSGFDYAGGLYAESDLEVLLQDVRVEYASGAALQLTAGAALAEGSGDLVFTNNGGLPIIVGADQTHTIPLEDYTGNARDGIQVTGATIPSSVTWPNHGIPYVVDGDVKLEGIAAAPAVLTIDPGVELRYEPDSSMMLSQRSGASGLIVDGTESEPVLMTADGAAVPGSWSGIAVFNGADSEQLRLSNLIIEYAGDEAYDAGIYMEASAIYVENLEIRHSLRRGMTMTNQARFAAGSSGLVIHDCDQPLIVPAGYVHMVPLDSQLTGNNLDYMYIRNDTQVDTSVTWRPLGGVDWWVEDNLRVGNRNVDGIVLTLEAGVVLRFEAETELQVGDSTTFGTASIRTLGTASQPVVLTSASAYHPGAWVGLTVGPYCTSDPVHLEHLEVAWSNISIAGCPVEMENVSLSGSGDVGLGITGSLTLATLDGVTISDSPGRGLRVRGGATVFANDLVVEDAGEEGIQVSGASLTVTGNSRVSDSASYGIEVDLGDLSLDGVDIERSGDHGVFFVDNTSGTIVLIDNTFITDSAGDGVHFDRHATDAVIQDSTLSGSGGYGVYVDPTRTQPSLINVSYSSNALGDIGP
ncbi:MAG: right-handed parallel beta-helix repeat-containing protein [Alphaproteobacteria bacterium]|nr:right-handed parallel beta-helix repeat-containing protein [Alphaproteobacteria bacterium]